MPLSMARTVGRGIGFLLSLSRSNIYRLTRINIALTQPQLSGKALERVIKDSVASTIINAFEMAIIWQHDNNWIDKKTLSIKGENHLISAIAEKKGVIIIVPHMGNWEVLGRHLPSYAATTSLYQPPRITALESIIKKGRELSGATLVPTNQRGVAAILKALRRGEITAILPDQVPQKKSGIFAPFYNKPAYTMTLVHNLLQKTGCRAVLGYALRTPGGFKVIYCEAPEALYSADQDTSITTLNTMVETAINDDIAQYQWGYKRFRGQPEGAKKFY